MVSVYRPLNLREALCIRHTENAQVLAGGTDFMVKRRRFLSEKHPVLCISQLKELQQVYRCADSLCIGTACTIADLLSSSLLPQYIKEPLAQIGSPAIRNVATIGGNLCNASPAADALPMLYALDAVLCLASEGGEETVPVQDFILAPGVTRLGKGQLLLEIRIPIERDWQCLYRKIGMRRVNSLSKISFYAIADHLAGRTRDVRIAFGAVAPTVVRCREAEQEILSGMQLPGSAWLRPIIAHYDSLLQPIDDARSSRIYRRTVALRLLETYLTRR